jgi:hypothetical protein
LARQQLIKALNNFKHKVVHPQSLPTLQNTASERKVTVESKKDAQRYNMKMKHKIKLHKPCIKVVQDMLIKRWIFIKKDKQPGNLTFKQILNTRRKPSRVRSIETVKELSNVAMHMIATKKIKEANEKCKTKGINNKQSPQKNNFEEGLSSESD